MKRVGNAIGSGELDSVDVREEACVQLIVTRCGAVQCEMLVVPAGSNRYWIERLVGYAFFGYGAPRLAVRLCVISLGQPKLQKSAIERSSTDPWDTTYVVRIVAEGTG